MMGLGVAYMQAKFDHSIFSCSVDMVGAVQNLNGSRELTTPLSDMICHKWASTATIILHTKFEVSNSAQYEDIIGDTNYRK